MPPGACLIWAGCTVDCSLVTLFYAPTYLDETLVVPCSRNTSQLTGEYNVSAVLTFDGDVALSTQAFQLSTVGVDTVDFQFTADDIRGQLGKWVRRA